MNLKNPSYIGILFTVIILTSCNNTNLKKNPENFIIELSPKDDYNKIKKEITENKLDSASGENYMYWLKNDELVKLFVFDEYPEAATYKEFYFNKNKLIAFQYHNIGLPIEMNYKALLFVNNGKIQHEEYWIDDIKKNKKSFLKYISTKQEMCGDDLSYDESILKDSKTKKNIVDLTLNLITKAYKINYNLGSKNKRILDKKSLSDIRNLVIYGNKRNLIRRLGKPDELLNGYDFMLEYRNWKPSSNYEYDKISYSVAYIYNNLCDKPIVVLFNNYNGKVFEVLYKEEIKSFEDISVDWRVR